MMNWNLLKCAGAYIKNYPRYVYGLWRISRLKQPIVTLFGAKRADQSLHYYQQAFQCAGMLVQNGFSVLSGGGPGIMEAVLCGAQASAPSKNYFLGIGVRGVDVEFKSACDQRIHVGDFATRKKLLIDHSCGFIVFPGGVGTLDELLEVINLIKTKKIKPVPVVLIGTEYWASCIDWFAVALKNNFIAPEHAKVFIVTDDIQHALHVVIGGLKR